MAHRSGCAINPSALARPRPLDPAHPLPHPRPRSPRRRRRGKETGRERGEAHLFPPQSHRWRAACRPRASPATNRR
uniref:Predicted protein n=1 Tax=Hordeum vulgare subsp. vulgare TaxID=112509 RepID=F2EGB0_HORVV|nr:predicted protein [Hordeum vulgare subsp. vulgare]